MFSARLVVDLVVIHVEDLDRGEKFGLARRLGLSRLALLYRFRAGLEVRRREGWHERVGQLAHCQAPIGYGAARILLDDGLKGFHSLWVEEIVQQRDGAVEFALHRTTGNREMHGAEAVVRGLLSASRSSHRARDDC